MRFTLAILVTLLLAGCGSGGEGADMHLRLSTERPDVGRVEQQGADGRYDVRTQTGRAKLWLPDDMRAVAGVVGPIEWNPTTVKVGTKIVATAAAATNGGFAGQIPRIVHDLVELAHGRAGTFAVPGPVAELAVFATMASSTQGWTATVARDGGDLRQIVVRFPVPALGNFRPAGVGEYRLSLG